MAEKWVDHNNEREYERVGRYCCIPDVDAVLALIRRYSIWGLGGSDGCECCNFRVRGYSVDVSCRKSEHCVRVHSGYLGHDASDGKKIAHEVLSQLSYPSSYAVRFCEYEYDHVNERREGGIWVKDQKCCYCGKSRPDAAAYLCDECKTNEGATASYPLSLVDYVNPFPVPGHQTPE